MELREFCDDRDIVQIGRLRLDAGLYDAPDEQLSNKRGKKPKKGTRQPSLKQLAIDSTTEWAATDIAWYAGEFKKVELATGTALWYVKGHDPRWIRWVLVRQPDRSKPGQAAAFFSSDVNDTAEQIVTYYAERWNIEVFFEEVRACLGFETQRGWSNRTIGRTTPCLFGIFSVIVILAKRLYPETLPVRQAAWYTKEDATFRDVLSAVREHLWVHNLAKHAQNNTMQSSQMADMCLIPSQLYHALTEIACYAA
jgi:hypothetical protein